MPKGTGANFSTPFVWIVRTAETSETKRASADTTTPTPRVTRTRTGTRQQPGWHRQRGSWCLCLEACRHCIFMVILLAIVMLYARIYILVKSSSRKVTNHNNSERSMALLRTVVIVVGVFIACWSPLFILLLIDVSCKVQECDILFSAKWFIVVAVLNSAMNPVIYTLASKEMRRAFLRLVCGCFMKSGVSRTLQIQPTPDYSRSKSSSCNFPKSKEELSPRAVPTCTFEKSEPSCHNGKM
ncbi:hypothetical protein NDU88_002788 [Pleurodeles waltl]|uniref:G-protein coupled receptors family 1 profile domain-containing protein n=1 Tax=Pleurodeles waltl TaxID=8319 RepID=A0AAV7W0N6_PLEWA|nr:hypothetical protein NDU88_002788 [Pleurodeles waltl]